MLTSGSCGAVVHLVTFYRLSLSFGAHIRHLGYLLLCCKCLTSGFLLLTLLDCCMDVSLYSVYLMVPALESNRGSLKSCYVYVHQIVVLCIRNIYGMIIGQCIIHKIQVIYFVIYTT